MGYLQPIECERARHAMSADMDAELSPLEETFLAAHVRRCATCLSFQKQLAGITAAVRQAPFESLRWPVALSPARPTRWQSGRRLAGASALAAVVLVALVGLATAPDRSTWSGDGALIASALHRPETANDLLIQAIRPTLASRQVGAIAYGAGGIGAYKPAMEAGT
jgi:predicted anti-sigma-YlaC factor YlaD